MKYWVYRRGEVPGNYEPQELARLSDFSLASLVCPVDGSPERAWRRAGLFADIVDAFRLREAVPVPLRLPAQDFIEGSGDRIFRHIAGLMRELERRREENELLADLREELVQLKDELRAAREKIRFLEDRVSLIPAFEDRERKAEEIIHRLKQRLAAREK